MSLYTNGLRTLFLTGCLLVLHLNAVAQYPCPAPADNGDVASRAWSYSIKLADLDHHILHITMHVDPTSPGLQVQLPVWNAIYQVRDFAEHLNWLRALDSEGKPVPVRKLDKTTWSVPNAVTVEYEIVAADPGPFSAEVSTQHAFLNLAQVLVYPVGRPKGVVTVEFAGVVPGWKVGTPLQSTSTGTAYCADSYDHLVDSPVEISNFRELTFSEGGGQFRVLIHTAEDYDPERITDTLRKIVRAETEWMQDRPFQQYTFIYHLPHGVGHGGMEHAYSTAIETSAERLRDDPLTFASVSAHEFFHLWNVKRIRPQSLEPIDYTKENYTRALWFSEGVDTTISDYMLVRAGLIDEKEFLSRLAAQIAGLQTRPAHKTQSAEDSSLDAWLEQYPYYRSAERSVNYYNKGQIIGVLLDLEIRERTHGQKSLRDLFLWMNAHYAKAGKFFDDSAGIRAAAEAVTGSNFEDFFTRFVSGTNEIPYNDFFRAVGLELKQEQVRTSYAGFSASTNFGPNPVVTAVDTGSEADRAGLRAGDVILTVNGDEPATDIDAQIACLEPGSTVKLKVSTRDRVHLVKIKLTERSEVQFSFGERSDATLEQKARRAAWMRGDSAEAH